MIAKNGSGIIDKIQRLALDADSFAYLLIDNRGVLLDQGGDLHSLVLPQWHPGENILDSALFLLGYLPMQNDYECIACYQLDDVCMIDVHLFKDEGEILAVLVDRSAEMADEARLRQQKNELKLKQRRARKMKKD